MAGFYHGWVCFVSRGLGIWLTLRLQDLVALFVFLKDPFAQGPFADHALGRELEFPVSCVSVEVFAAGARVLLVTASHWCLGVTANARNKWELLHFFCAALQPARQCISWGDDTGLTSGVLA
jgi:hypothetical protein